MKMENKSLHFKKLNKKLIVILWTNMDIIKFHLAFHQIPIEYSISSLGIGKLDKRKMMTTGNPAQPPY